MREEKHLFPPPAGGPFAVKKLLYHAGMQLLGLDEVQRVYREACSLRQENFAQAVLDIMGIHVELSEAGRSRIPASGPFIIAANHPFGAVDGLILTALLHSVRKDAKTWANYILGRIPELREKFILLDPFGSSAAARANMRPLRETIDWLRQGGALISFPAGEVSSIRDFHDDEAEDPQWSDMPARLARQTGVPVLPVCFSGQNSRLFQLAGLIHPRLRTALLAREFLNMKNSSVTLHIGSLIPAQKLKGFSSDTEATEYIRKRTYMLRNKDLDKKLPMTVSSPGMRPVADAVAPDIMAGEIEQLPRKKILLESGDYVVASARADEIPNILHEIGRLRELSFRAVGEGTGKSSDLDEFDAYYTHLFVWNKARREVVGSYRLGKTDYILRHFGIQGLYTSTLFSIRPEFLNHITPALELGRSFIRSEYQKNYSPLLLLWRGICTYIARHPRYRHLFGPVSISNDYSAISQEIIISSLIQNNFDHKLARLVRAKTPFRIHHEKKFLPLPLPRDIEEVSLLVGDIEPDTRGVPILIRQYLRLGARFLSFNIDAGFNNAVDGLVMVDLLGADRTVLEKYMGREAMENYFNAYESEDLIAG